MHKNFKNLLLIVGMVLVILIALFFVVNIVTSVVKHKNTSDTLAQPEVVMNENNGDSSIIYKNNVFQFQLSFPETWEGYMVKEKQMTHTRYERGFIVKRLSFGFPIDGRTDEECDGCFEEVFWLDVYKNSVFEELEEINNAEIDRSGFSVATNLGRIVGKDDYHTFITRSGIHGQSYSGKFTFERQKEASIFLKEFQSNLDDSDSIIYQNNDFDFTLTLPKSFKGYSIKEEENTGILKSNVVTLGFKFNWKTDNWTTEECDTCFVEVLDIDIMDEAFFWELKRQSDKDIAVNGANPLNFVGVPSMIHDGYVFRIFNRLNQALPPEPVNKKIQGYNFRVVAESLKPIKKELKESEICVTPPTSTPIGMDVYPIAPQYENLKFLGQIFTDYDCGSTRTDKIYGVDGENYILGSRIRLKDKPRASLSLILDSIGYDHKDGDFKVWTLKDTVKIKDLIILKYYSEYFKSDDCVNCG